MALHWLTPNQFRGRNAPAPVATPSPRPTTTAASVVAPGISRLVGARMNLPVKVWSDPERMAKLKVRRVPDPAMPTHLKGAQMTEDEKAQYAYYFRSMGIDVPTELEPKPVITFRDGSPLETPWFMRKTETIYCHNHPGRYANWQLTADSSGLRRYLCNECNDRVTQLYGDSWSVRLPAPGCPLRDPYECNSIQPLPAMAEAW